MKKILILIIFFYILTLVQISFLIHFNISGIIPNLILISVIFLNFFENPQRNSGYFAAISGGFFLDIFSGSFMGINFIGFWISILLVLSFFIKFILRKYVRISFSKGT